MADNVPLVVADGESTPVSHTLSPRGVSGDTAKYQNYAVTFAEGRETATLKVAEPKGLQKTEIVLLVPRVLDETINGVTVSRVADYATIRTTAIIPKTWDEQAAKNVRVMGSNMLLVDPVADAIDKGEFVW
jgi:hypothetical protein